MSNASYYNRRASPWVPVDVAFVPRFPSNRRFFNESSHVNNCSLGTAVNVLEKPLRGTQRGFPPEFTENPF